eukprot:TRINITY_DN833_c0_g1_i1.p1 TRINITY_DN833_c0_g1~~TRINITY_DN833_c0_g1_i1.p1  ORF type:complete len:387 (+),score=51.40 TRINITY_DN833_c0_g1_i1:99-1259(+)
MSKKTLEFLESVQVKHPDISPIVKDFSELYTRRLWHQLTEKILESLPELEKTSILPVLYHEFIQDFAHKINLLKLAYIAVRVSNQFSDTVAAIEFLTGVVESLESGQTPSQTQQPILFINMQIAQFRLKLGQTNNVKEMIESALSDFSNITDVDPNVGASVYYASSLLHKAQANFSEYYRAALMYLCYVESEKLPHNYKLGLAVDISLAALLGDEVYNFGELLLHPIVNVLEQSEYAWLLELLHCFNDGDLHKYDQLCQKHSAQLNGQPALVQNSEKLREKITILALMYLIFQLPAEQRQIPLDQIAQRTKLNNVGVEALLMKALELHLIEGVIDEVDGYVQVSWVQPRVLTLPQLQQLDTKLVQWISQVQSAVKQLEDEGVTLAD